MTEFERLLQNHIDGREIVSTMQTPAQRVALGVAARHYAGNQPIVEIGSALGGSAMLMAAATIQNQTPIHSIDPDVATRDIMRFAFQRHGWLDRLHQIIKTSDEAIAELSEMHGNASLVFIDGLHTFDAVVHDFENYAPLIAPGGALLFHDITPQIHPVFEAVLGHVLRDSRFVPQCLVDGLMILERCA